MSILLLFIFVFVNLIFVRWFLIFFYELNYYIFVSHYSLHWMSKIRENSFFFLYMPVFVSNLRNYNWQIVYWSLSNGVSNYLRIPTERNFLCKTAIYFVFKFIKRLMNSAAVGITDNSFCSFFLTNLISSYFSLLYSFFFF